MMKSARVGFTLVEVMIVVAILTIMAAIAIPNFIAYRMQSQKSGCIANMKAIIQAEEAYLIKNGRYAESISALCNRMTGDDFLRREPVCPCGGTYSYVPPSGGKQGTATCSGGKYKEGYEHTLKSVGIGAE